MAHEWAEGRQWSEFEMTMFENMAHDTDALDDRMLHTMFHIGYFDQDVSHEIRVNARNWVEEHLADEYEFDFGEWFDWQSWREQYEPA